MPKKASTSEQIACDCGCGQHVKPGQRWHEPACKARAYRVRQRAYADEHEEEQQGAVDRIFELSRQLASLEQVYTRLREEHSQCAPPASDVRPGEAWAWRLFLEALDAAYRNLAKQYHPDRYHLHSQMAEKMTVINGTYAEIGYFIRRHTR